jgi:hypothetical protein
MSASDEEGRAEARKSPDCVRVVVRIRPMIGREKLEKCSNCAFQSDSNPNQVGGAVTTASQSARAASRCRPVRCTLSEFIPSVW